MPLVTVALLVAWSGICCVWLGLIVAQSRMRRDRLILEGAPGRSLPDGAPSVCVVIAARNESAGLDRCLRHVLAQQYPSLRVLVVDDRSEDDTFEIARRISASDARVHVARVHELPSGWMGKSHALWSGARTVRADWLLFTDVDCTFGPHAVSAAVAEACERNVQLLTLWPRQAPGGFWEHAVIPLCGAIIALWFGSRRSTDPRYAMAFANGQFILIEGRTYHRIAGHAAVRSAIIEDIPLAELAKRSGVACWVASGRNLLTVRMYDGYEAIRDGWARIFVGALRSGNKIAASIAWLLAGSLLPYVAAVVLAARFLASKGDEVDPQLVGLAVVCASHLTLMLIASYRFWAAGGCRRIDLLWYPLSVCVVARILARAWWWLVIEQSIPWRGTRYRIDRQGRVLS